MSLSVGECCNPEKREATPEDILAQSATPLPSSLLSTMPLEVTGYLECAVFAPWTKNLLVA